MPKVHDRGGQAHAGHIDHAEHDYSLWEKRADAISALLQRQKLWRVDEKRRTLESMDPEQYERLGYYERWVVATESLLVEKGVATSQEVDARMTQDGERGQLQQRIDALAGVLMDKGLFTADDVRRQIEDMDSRTPAAGAQIVARAWTDPAFKARLLSDAKAACAELGIDASGITNLQVLENTPGVHYMVVCTLCSCYPRPILGLPPDWYKSLAYRSRAVVEPRAVLHEFGLDLPAEVEVRVVDSTADTRFLVLPERPAGTEHLDEQQLAALVTRDCMIGVALPDGQG